MYNLELSPESSEKHESRDMAMAAEFDDGAGKALSVHISSLRHKLEPFGLHILSKPGIGYVLSAADCVCPATDAQRSADQ